MKLLQYRRTVIKLNQSLGINIPTKEFKRMGLTHKQKVAIFIADNRIYLIPLMSNELCSIKHKVRTITFKQPSNPTLVLPKKILREFEVKQGDTVIIYPVRNEEDRWFFYIRPLYQRRHVRCKNDKKYSIEVEIIETGMMHQIDYSKIV